MRVLTTWMYFDALQINSDQGIPRPGRRGEEIDPGVGIAWFGGDTARLGSISNLKVFRELRPRDPELNETVLKNYLDLFVMDARERDFDRRERSLKNEPIAEYILTEPFIIERSPPAHLNLKSVSKSTNLPVWIGTYLGWSVVPDHSVLLFLTVPGGIIVVSSAAGLASALAAGLAKSVKRLFR